MNELLTAREVQDILKVDRTTVYRMLKDGRLSGVKVGQQWRFARESVQAILSGGPAEPSAPSRPADVLPLHCIQPIQDVFAEVGGMGAITVAADGAPLTEPSGDCAFCRLIQSSPAGRQACQESWRRLADVAPGVISMCHAGLSYAHAPIRVEGERVATLIAGQFHSDPADAAMFAARIAHLGASYSLSAAELAAAAPAIPTLSAHTKARLAGWLGRVAATFETIARERATLLGRLRRIAEITILDED